MDLAEVLKKPIITEKSTQAASLGRYTFWVDKRATKKEIARAVATFFKVRVEKVWTMRTGNKEEKKAVVQLAAGEKLDIFAVPGEEREKGGK